MGHKNTIFLALIATLIAKEAFAAQHVVGGSQGWDQSTDFKSWTSGQTSKVGDKLGMFLLHNYYIHLFRYLPSKEFSFLKTRF